MPAKDLYRSTWFVLARNWIERKRLPWYILSAKHGLVHPDTSVAPYDETLNSMGVAARRAWAKRVETQIDEMLPTANEVIVFAGQRYRVDLEECLRRKFTSVNIPMKKLRIGQQLSWLKHGQR